MLILWIIIGVIAGFFMASGVVGWLTFPFEAYKAQQEAFIDQYCRYPNGTNNGQCAIEPIGFMDYVLNGLRTIGARLVG